MLKFLRKKFFKAAPAASVSYDFTKQHNDAGGQKRRQARVERVPEEQILRPHQRNLGINLIRDCQRNNPQARGIAKTLRSNIIGSYGKLRFNNSDEWYKNAQRYFNNVWARHADFVDGTSFRECLQLVTYSIAHEGDFVCVFDDGVISGKPHGTGKLLFFESDQICNLDAADFAEYAELGYSQEAGIIHDSFGRKCGVIVTGERGISSVPKSKAFVLIHDPDDSADPFFVHVGRKFRLRQMRAVSDAIPSLTSTIDGREALDYELQTAKRAATHYAAVIESGNSTDSFVRPTGFDNFSDESADSDTDDTSELTAIEEDYHAQRLEHCTGGNVDYYENGTQVVFDPTNRPNTNLTTFLDYTTDMAGASLGLTHSYTRMKADTSYTAFRGDMVMSWMTFVDFQQFLEDAFSDWVARMVIARALKLNLIDAAPAHWEELIAWQYPTMPAVDEQKEQSALTLKLKNCQTTLAQTIGAHWREQIDQLAVEQAYIREKGVSFAAMEVIGGTTTNKEEE